LKNIFRVNKSCSFPIKMESNSSSSVFTIIYGFVTLFFVRNPWCELISSHIVRLPGIQILTGIPNPVRLLAVHVIETIVWINEEPTLVIGIQYVRCQMENYDCTYWKVYTKLQYVHRLLAVMRFFFSLALNSNYCTNFYKKIKPQI